MKTIIITGANRGIGFECALQMAKMAKDEQIIITSRDLNSGDVAAQKIKEKTGHTHIKAMLMDLGSLGSIRQFVNNFSHQKSGGSASW